MSTEFQKRLRKPHAIGTLAPKKSEVIWVQKFGRFS